MINELQKNWLYMEVNMRKDGDYRRKEFLGKRVNQNDCIGHVSFGEQKKVVPVRDSDECIHVCETCGRFCTLKNGHYGKHECPEGHTWW
jgi:hypothetical protein